MGHYFLDTQYYLENLQPVPHGFRLVIVSLDQIFARLVILDSDKDRDKWTRSDKDRDKWSRSQ